MLEFIEFDALFCWKPEWVLLYERLFGCVQLRGCPPLLQLGVRPSVIHYRGMQGECFQDERRETIWGILLYHSRLACRLLPNAGYCLPSWSTSERCSTMLFSARWQDDYNVKSCCVTSMPGVRCSSSAFIALGMRESWREGADLHWFSNSRSA